MYVALHGEPGHKGGMIRLDTGQRRNAALLLARCSTAWLPPIFYSLCLPPANQLINMCRWNGCQRETFFNITRLKRFEFVFDLFGIMDE